MSRSTHTVVLRCFTILLTSAAIVGVFGASVAPVARASAAESDSGGQEKLIEEADPEPTSEESAAWTAFHEDFMRFVDDGEMENTEIIDGAPSRMGNYVIHEAEREADLYWAGELPEAVQKVIDLNPEITVHVHESKYSMAEMAAARDEVTPKVMPDGLRLMSVGPENDASGIIVQVSPERGKAFSENEAARLAADLTEFTGVSIRMDVLEAGSEHKTFAGRQSDSSPFYGGAGAIVKYPGANAQYCSTGASVVGRATGNKYLTTAYHCIYYYGAFGSSGSVDTPQNASLGTWHRTSSQVEANRDAALIDIDSGKSVAGRSFWGSATSNTSIEVTDAATSPIGSTVCMNGANSGTHCAEVYRSNFTWYFVDTSIPLQNVVGARNKSVSYIAASGDSGGPVFSIDGAGNHLKGFIYGPNDYTSSHANCGSGAGIYNWNSSIQCSNDVIYVGGVNNYLDALGVDLR